ncbi:TetR/AcrR family transcriptional regulator [Arthrobacter sp. ISL-85]|uniref:TetR/AcrR family transcriptional regulator n=1 Tax=Arthrobacter sp. ISL-85 TaxID=2819115 RepID=UPI001BEAB048|nr:TetR/AcrR family transcriptional regulator [Arthrobacter sp. ISL-85]MBT2566952.1 TetR/AcrR family transcriptional regulator [Arthrobacter sp. ISL-85]
MSRWKPAARQRLAVAALDLFAEQGYDATTVAQIAERAGLTRSTFFRYFGDKREILSAGQEMLSLLLAEGIAAAPEDATPLDAVAAGLDRASGAMTDFNRELGPRLHAAIEANEELRARSAMKSIGMAAAMADALRQRGVSEAAAQVSAELGVLAFGIGYRRWADPAGKDAPGELVAHTRTAFAELRSATATLR